MVFLFGEQSKVSLIDTGQFHCPVCEQTRAYQHIQHKNYFTLFFIPLLPLESLADYIECSHCEHSFHNSILEAEKGEQVAAYQYVLLTVLFSLTMVKPLQQHITEIYQNVCEQALSDEDYQQACQQYQTQSPNIHAYLRHSRLSLNIKGRLRVMEAAVQWQQHDDPVLSYEQRVQLNQLLSLLELDLGWLEQRLNAGLQKLNADKT